MYPARSRSGAKPWSFLNHWAFQDPDAAWEWWVDHPVVSGLSNPRDSSLSVMGGYARKHGEKAALEWLGHQFVKTFTDDLEEELSDVLEAVTDTPWRVEALAGSMPSTELCDTIWQAAAWASIDTSCARMLGYLEHLSNDEIRRAYLMERVYCSASWHQYASTEERQLVDDAMVSWGGTVPEPPPTEE